MSSQRIIRFSLLAVLFVLPQVLLAAANTTEQLSHCSPCQTSVCPHNCLQLCTPKCLENYFESDLVCETPATSTTTTSTMTTTTTQTTPTTPTNQTNQTTEPTLPPPPHAEMPQPPSSKRRRRQAGNTTEQISTDTISNITDTTNTTTTLTTTSPSTTTPQPTKVCRLCYLESCTTCQEDPEKNLICVKCLDGYSVSNDRKSCSKDGLSVGAIVGIVIGALAFVAVVGVAVFLVRRFRGSKEVSDQESFRNNSNTNDFDSEQYEIGKLGDAPSPPTEDTTKRYDSLKVTNVDDPQSYSPIDIQKEARYANCDEAEPKNQHTHYANTPQRNTSRPSASKRPQNLKTTVAASVSADSAELYEPIDTTGHEKPQEDYVNTAELLGKLKNTTDAQQTQQFYYNDNNGIVEADYEIT
ncbi:hypothetical protein BsWGS_24220 [Bradybaena similaris]